MIVWLKLLHIGSVSVWMAGLISLPGLFLQRAHVERDERLFLLQRTVRFAYVRLMSPAAFIAIATGAALIFVSEAFEAWLSAKLALVGVLTLFHTLTGLVINRLFREGEAYPVWRFLLVTSLTLVLVLGVLYFVLAKPRLDAGTLVPAALTEPGGLQRLIETISLWPIS
jgi:protoporphyrinogen IX oxidase